MMAWAKSERHIKICSKNFSSFSPLAKMTHSSEKFCLKWNDFTQNTVSFYHELRYIPDFSDVTLVCEEDHQIEAHRIILTACSPLFSNILKKNLTSHPLIYMRGIFPKDLVAIVDFIYHGEANVFQDDLDGFLALAEELQLKGLTGSQSEHLDEKEETIKKSKTPKPTIRKIPKHDVQPYMSPSNEIDIDESFEESFTMNSVVPFVGGPINITGEFTKEEMDAKKMSLIRSLKIETGFAIPVLLPCKYKANRLYLLHGNWALHRKSRVKPVNESGKLISATRPGFTTSEKISATDQCLPAWFYHQ